MVGFRDEWPFACIAFKGDDPGTAPIADNLGFLSQLFGQSFYGRGDAEFIATAEKKPTPGFKVGPCVAQVLPGGRSAFLQVHKALCKTCILELGSGRDRSQFVRLGLVPIGPPAENGESPAATDGLHALEFTNACVFEDPFVENQFFGCHRFSIDDLSGLFEGGGSEVARCF